MCFVTPRQPLKNAIIALSLLALAAPLAANESEDEDGRHAAPATADQAAPRPEDPDGPPARRDEDRDDDGGEARESAANQDEAEPEPAMPPAPDPVAPLTLLDQSVPVGTFDTLYWTPDQSFRSIATPVPVLVAHGTKPGPHLCLTAAVHGDELNGIEMVRRLMYELEPDELAGTVVGVPIVNLDGFRNGSRYLSDRRDLNRYFPGRKSGSAASRVAYSLFENIVRHCDYLVDLHTGSQKRINQPQLRADLEDPRVVAFAKHFGGMTVLHSPPADGMLRAAAVDEGIVAVTMEAGGPNRLEEEAVDYGVQALETLLENLDMRKASRFWGAPQPVFYESEWIRAGQGGILLSEVELNEQVSKGQILGTVTDPISNTGSAIIAPYDGRVLGMAVNQVVHAGFAAYRIGEEKSAEEVEAKAEQAQEQGDSDGDGENTGAGASTEESDRPDGDTE
ncbi:MAG: succinylglutamate desuccinylase [Alcanivorax sp.]|nr:succinylglutamate desuccinylase [Alcanivorax sp.]MAY10440.1 succinylglutamate desuccinylase [Alcanivorax sp.]MBI53520.1 succinylglutamate desuccinylase [Alcanivorax sp.]MBU60601.1 succinylglutamate desuccinylase [Alcanivorax sp.]HCE41576.1 succinylglutamate desuccinylase [Alcanivorax sp.]|tara:strand:- start:876 stop:2228 length:1353 start_codon:yes stop_codon:yes gene_type:complete